MMLLSFLQMLAIFYLYGRVMNSASLFNSFGYHDTRATIVGLMLFFNIFSPVRRPGSLVSGGAAAMSPHIRGFGLKRGY